MDNFLLVGWNNGNGFEYGYGNAKRNGTGYGNLGYFGYSFYVVILPRISGVMKMV